MGCSILNRDSGRISDNAFAIIMLIERRYTRLPDGDVTSMNSMFFGL